MSTRNQNSGLRALRTLGTLDATPDPLDEDDSDETRIYRPSRGGLAGQRVATKRLADLTTPARFEPAKRPAGPLHALPVTALAAATTSPASPAFTSSAEDTLRVAPIADAFAVWRQESTPRLRWAARLCALLVVAVSASFLYHSTGQTKPEAAKTDDSAIATSPPETVSSAGVADDTVAPQASDRVEQDRVDQDSTSPGEQQTRHSGVGVPLHRRHGATTKP